jgi:hypothetical protein
MIRGSIGKLLVGVALLALTTTAATANSSPSGLKASLSGFQENPPKLTNGSGTFMATATNNSISFTLTYSGLSTPAFMSHLHFGQTSVNGGVFVWLCGVGSSARPTCPAGTTSEATVTGTITAADIVPTNPDQGISAGDWAGAVRIIMAGAAYVNVHTSNFPGGEIRGQIKAGRSENDES